MLVSFRRYQPDADYLTLIKAELLEQKSVNICQFLDAFIQGRADAMARAGTGSQ